MGWTRKTELDGVPCREYCERSDGCYVWWDDKSPHINPLRPNSRLWIAYYPEGGYEKYGARYLATKPRDTRHGESVFNVPRRFKTAEAAMKALDKAHPEEA